MKAENTTITFAKARKMVETALNGTAYEKAPLEEYGGGDGPEDIKPFRIARKGLVNLGATIFPEGGILFWVWAEDGVQKEFDTAAEAIEVFNR